ncbi:MAG: hypothetical protein EBS98_09230 [Chitinophagia bacterium]|nr:hypothetical protein [Chitinophagia bacterium]
MKISYIKKIEKEKVYDITVEEQHHYILENGVVTHNSGLKYAASTIAMLSKKKEKDGDQVVGNIIKIKTYKSRMSKENREASVLLTYSKGLDRYYGLIDLAEKYNIFKKVSTRYELPSGEKVFGKTINEDPEKYYTEDILKQLDEAAAKEYKYGV